MGSVVFNHPIGRKNAAKIYQVCNSPCLRLGVIYIYIIPTTYHLSPEESTNQAKQGTLITKDPKTESSGHAKSYKFSKSGSHVSNEKNLGWLGYIGDYTAQLYWDFNKPL